MERQTDLQTRKTPVCHSAHKSQVKPLPYPPLKAYRYHKIEIYGLRLERSLLLHSATKTKFKTAHAGSTPARYIHETRILTIPKSSFHHRNHRHNSSYNIRIPMHKHNPNHILHRRHPSRIGPNNGKRNNKKRKTINWKLIAIIRWDQL